MATPLSTVRLYTPAEDEFIRSNWGTMAITEMARHLQRHQGSVSSRASALGLAAAGDGVRAHNAATLAATARFEARLRIVAARHGVPLLPRQPPTAKGRGMSQNSEYQRGYRAGRRRTEAEMEKMRLDFEASCAATQQQRVQVFCAALIGMLASPRVWNKGGKPYSSIEDYVGGARLFVEQAEQQRVIR